MIFTGMWAVYLYINYWFPGVLMWVGALGHISIVTYLLYTFIPGIGVAYLVVSMVLLFSVLSYMVGGFVVYINFKIERKKKGEQQIRIKDNTMYSKYLKKMNAYLEFEDDDRNGD